MSVDASPAPVRVLIAGGSYAGLTAALQLSKLCNGYPLADKYTQYVQAERRDSPLDTYPEPPKIPLKITIADERDGFCQ